MPFRQEFAETLDRRCVVNLAPDENKRDGLGGPQWDKAQLGIRGTDELRHHADPSARFDIGHHGADQAGRLNDFGNDASATTARNHSVVKSHAFAAREHD